MKLIIDIDEKRIKGIKLLAKEQDIATPYPTLEQIIANGIPLDKIRTEVENDWQLKKYPSSPFSCGLRRAIEIIDKHTGVSE